MAAFAYGVESTTIHIHKDIVKELCLSGQLWVGSIFAEEIPPVAVVASFFLVITMPATWFLNVSSASMHKKLRKWLASVTLTPTKWQQSFEV